MGALDWINLLVLILGPILLVGLINRTKAIWAGRKGPRLDQFFHDLVKLLRKTSVRSEVTSWLYPNAPWLILATTLAAAALAPLVPGHALISFPYDFIYFAYLLGLGRALLILGALDTGSSFEGMGASREATFSALAEPAFFLFAGTLGLLTGQTTFQELLTPAAGAGAVWPVRILLGMALFILTLVENGRVPVDDPNTHLELTMIHEVMILDHSGPELAALQGAAALKLTVYAGILAALFNPISGKDEPIRAALVSIALLIAVAVLLGLVESLIARLRMRAVPAFAWAGTLTAALSLLLLAIGQRYFAWFIF